MKLVEMKLAKTLAALMILLALASFEAMAQSTTEQINLSEVAVSENDYGQSLLNFVTFGQYDAPSDSSQKSLLSTVSRVICTIALYMMAVLSVVGGATYIIQTANKGVPGGQVISSFWLPLRICVSTILLIPLSSGYSTLQLKGVYPIASTGNAHGGLVANYGAEFLISNGAYNAPLLNSPREVINGLVASELCKIRTDAALRRESIQFVQRQNVNGTTFDYSKKPFGRITRPTEHPNYCGSISFLLPSTIEPTRLTTSNFDNVESNKLDYEDKAYIELKSRGPALIQSWQAQAAAIAAKIAYDEAALKDLQDNNNLAFKSEADKESAMLSAAANDLKSLYSSAEQQLQTELAEIVNSVRGAQSASGKPKWKEELEEYGWTYLAMIYWQTGQNMQLINSIASTLTFTYTQPTPDSEFQDDERNEKLQLRYKEVMSIIESTGYIADGGSGRFLDLGGVEDAGNSGSGFFKRWVASLTQSMMSSLVTDENSDFVTQMQSTGNSVGSFVDLSYHGIILAKSTVAGVEAGTKFTISRVSESASKIPFIGPVIGAFTGAGGGLLVGLATAIKVAAFEYFELIQRILGPLLLASFMLAIVLPCIPLFYWFMGVVSWILFYVECLIISPIWLAAHGTAEKEGWGTEHTRQGYMLMIGLYLNPILRCAGFFAVLVVLYPLTILIKWMSSYLIGVISTGAVTSPLMLVGAMLVLAFFGYSVANRVFSLPNEMFEKGLRWVNGGQEVTGDENSATKINAMVANFGYKAEGGFGAGKMSQQKAAGEGDPNKQNRN